MKIASLVVVVEWKYKVSENGKTKVKIPRNCTRIVKYLRKCT